MSEVFADFINFPGVRTGNDPFVSDVIFTDNYGDEHLVPAVRFKRTGP